MSAGIQELPPVLILHVAVRAGRWLGPNQYHIPLSLLRAEKNVLNLDKTYVAWFYHCLCKWSCLVVRITVINHWLITPVRFYHLMVNWLVILLESYRGVLLNTASKSGLAGYNVTSASTRLSACRAVIVVVWSSLKEEVPLSLHTIVPLGSAAQPNHQACVQRHQQVIGNVTYTFEMRANEWPSFNAETLKFSCSLAQSGVRLAQSSIP